MGLIRNGYFSLKLNVHVFWGCLFNVDCFQRSPMNGAFCKCMYISVFCGMMLSLIAGKMWEKK